MASSRLAGYARLCDDGRNPSQSERITAPKKNAPNATVLIRWSVQEIRRIAVRLAQRRIDPAYIIAWSLWRRAHQATAQKAHLRSKMQL
jgi:hypothetical protein